MVPRRAQIIGEDSVDDDASLGFGQWNQPVPGTIQTLDRANSMFSCAVFLAKPPQRTLVNPKLEGSPQTADLVLRLAPEAILQFKERPLSATQAIEPLDETGWYHVRDPVPMTLPLLPFLPSMGAGWRSLDHRQCPWRRSGVSPPRCDLRVRQKVDCQSRSTPGRQPSEFEEMI